MRYLALIPARYASSRFPGKPLIDILGKTMIERVYEKCAAVFPNCYVATDDSRIMAEVERFSGRAVMTSTTHRSGTDRCREALDKLGGPDCYDVVINIQGDEPFIAQQQLEQIKECFQDPKTDIATLVKPFAADEDIFNANSPKVVISNDGFALYFSRSVIPHLRGLDKGQWQDKYQYYKHIGLYGYRASVLRQVTDLEPSGLEIAESLEQLRWLENGYRIKTATTHLESHAIDTPEDLQKIIEPFH